MQQKQWCKKTENYAKTNLATGACVIYSRWNRLWCVGNLPDFVR